ncbi:MAG: ribonuclease HI [Desulfobacteraceae bacterium]|nr:ribonuclease HI [Desulfobacteraceae bacterium]MDH3575118.1 ribonuclease HI [Desulfobacteraceae bacterium]MDH3720336.1 ribonuclease HI [Desulfobacteraceae bacterium]MDH3835486.1 ribonuclease HI [Desulfobacteraceae bacterium]MDH3873565.1 ribonuclease HI [Desulfobacteraceae bacterium]
MADDNINWKRMVFKKNKVWLATDQDQKPVTKNGKVLIRYQLDQDYEYWVLSKNITPIDSLQKTEKTEKGKKSTQKSSKQKDTKTISDTGVLIETSCDNAINIYTDGASSGNPGPSGIGVVLCFGKHEKEISRYIGITTNNMAELEAIRSGLMAVKNSNLPVRVFTDSRYAYGVLTQGWKAKKNQDIIESIKKILSKFNDLKFIKVKGHAGIEGNERADFLATSAIKKAKIE